MDFRSSLPLQSLYRDLALAHSFAIDLETGMNQQAKNAFEPIVALTLSEASQASIDMWRPRQ